MVTRLSASMFNDGVYMPRDPRDLISLLNMHLRHQFKASKVTMSPRDSPLPQRSSQLSDVKSTKSNRPNPFCRA